LKSNIIKVNLMKRTSRVTLTSILLAASFLTAVSSANADGGDSSRVYVQASEDRETPIRGPIGYAGGAAAASAPITYHQGGQVLTGPVNVYVIWYGSWVGTGSAPVASTKTSTAASKTLISNFLASIGNTPRFLVNSTYYSQASTNGLKTYVSGQVNFAGETSVNATSDLNPTSLLGVVNSAIAAPRWVQKGATTPYLTTPVADPNGVYFVLTSAGIRETSGFLTRFCGWHSYATTVNSSTTLKYSFVGDASANLAACAGQTATSPNSVKSGKVLTTNLVAADALISVLTHELEETVTDPQLNAWFDKAGLENADKCAWTWGATTINSANGSTSNLSLGSASYLVQQNWNATSQTCVKG
jgi:hypothetical protein